MADRWGDMTTASSIVSLAIELLASVVAPPECAACDTPVPMLAVFCAACATTVERARQNGGPAIAAFEYGGAIARAITRLKYNRRADLARPLGDLLWGALQPHARGLRDALVVPVPLHPSRLAERGFNQSALLARPIARRLGASLLPLALARVRETPQQTALDRGARMANVAGAFCVRQRNRVRGRAVLLVDDVRTTGATMDACARALIAAGAAWVAQAVLADVQPTDP
jgi:ComF family protein